MRSSPRPRPFALLALAWLCILSTAAAQAQGRPPNVILVVADDLGYGDLGAYGQRRIRTDALDRMAREGAVFDAFYAGSPICAPSRAVLLTGLHSGHAAIRANSVNEREVPLPGEAVTLGEVMRGAGYRTAAIGKWGLGHANTPGAPGRQGFDSFFGFLDQVSAHNHYPDSLWESRGETTRRVPARPGVYAHDEFMARALDFVGAGGGRPFFLYLAVTLPHVELAAPDSSVARYRRGAGSLFDSLPREPGTAPRDPLATYAAMVTHLDRSVGRLLHELAARGLDSTTVVMVTSDNGPNWGAGGAAAFFGSAGGFRGGKRDLYEGGIRVPLVVRWPGRVSPGRRVAAPAAAWDLLPTLAHAAGAPVPPGMDGRSLLPVLSGGAAPERPLYWEFTRGQVFRQAVRLGNWKLIRTVRPYGRRGVELYDLAADPAERNDVARRHPGRVRALAAYTAWRTAAPAYPGPEHRRFSAWYLLDLYGLPLALGAAACALGALAWRRARRG